MTYALKSTGPRLLLSTTTIDPVRGSALEETRNGAVWSGAVKSGFEVMRQPVVDMASSPQPSDARATRRKASRRRARRGDRAATPDSAVAEVRLRCGSGARGEGEGRKRCMAG